MTQEHFELIARIDERTKNMAEKQDKYIISMNQHINDDASAFKGVKTNIFWLTIAMVVIGMIVGGPELVSKLIK